MNWGWGSINVVSAGMIAHVALEASAGSRWNERLLQVTLGVGGVGPFKDGEALGEATEVTLGVAGAAGGQAHSARERRARGTSERFEVFPSGLLRHERDARDEAVEIRDQRIERPGGLGIQLVDQVLNVCIKPSSELTVRHSRRKAPIVGDNGVINWQDSGDDIQAVRGQALIGVESPIVADRGDVKSTFRNEANPVTIAERKRRIVGEETWHPAPQGKDRHGIRTRNAEHRRSACIDQILKAREPRRDSRGIDCDVVTDGHDKDLRTKE